ncbi:MAG: cytochrome P450 [Chlamydiota bacterium]|nr:cytochrome P450 [Chlamydiota bacterium]
MSVTNVNSCPFAHQQEEGTAAENTSGASRKAIELARVVFNLVKDTCPYADSICSTSGKIVDWGVNSYRYLQDGSVESFNRVMKIPGTESYRPYCWFPVAHRVGIPLLNEGTVVNTQQLLLVSHPTIIKKILLEFRDGSTFSGGPEFQILGSIIGNNNPLTEKNISKQRAQKSWALNHLFGHNSIRQKTITFLGEAEKFISERLTPNQNYHTFNITNILPEYSIQVSKKIIFGTDKKLDEIPGALSTLEQIISDCILYKPQAFVPEMVALNKKISKDKLTRTVKKIIDLPDNQDGLVSQMKKEGKFSSEQLNRMTMVKESIIDQDDKKRIVSSIYSLVTNHTYLGHFFDIAEKENLNVNQLRHLSNMTSSENRRLILENFDFYFTTLSENDEINKFLHIVTLMLKEEKKNKFDHDQIESMIKTILVIGSGTTKSTLNSAFYCLLKNPEYQERLYNTITALDLRVPTTEEWQRITRLELASATIEEIDLIRNIPLKQPYPEEEIRSLHSKKIDSLTASEAQKVDTYNHFLTTKKLLDKEASELTPEEFEELKKLKLQFINEEIHEKLFKCTDLVNFFNEVMRMHTPIPVQARTAVDDMEIQYDMEGKSEVLQIPKGTTVYLTAYQANNDEQYWENPLEFNPSRFNDSNVRKNFFPFSPGKNMCMGRFHANSALISLIYHIIMKYKILPPITQDGETKEQTFIMDDSFTYKFTKDLWIRLEPRTVL